MGSVRRVRGDFSEAVMDIEKSKWRGIRVAMLVD